MRRLWLYLLGALCGVGLFLVTAVPIVGIILALSGCSGNEIGRSEVGMGILIDTMMICPWCFP